MIEFTPRQQKTVASAVTALAGATIVATGCFTFYVASLLFSRASSVLVPVMLGFFLATLFEPYFSWWRRRVKNATLAFICMCATVLAPASLIVWYGGSFAAEQVVRFVGEAPDAAVRASEWVNKTFPQADDFAEQIGAPAGVRSFLTEPRNFAKGLLTSVAGKAAGTSEEGGWGVVKYLNTMTSVLIALLFFAYFVTVGRKVSGEAVVREMPFFKPQTKAFIAQQFDAFCDIMVGFFRRQVVICLIEGVLYGLGFWVVGLPYGFVLGFVLGVLNLVPFLGSVIVMPLTVAISYFGASGSIALTASVTGVWLAGQILDAYLITPKIQGDRTGLGYAGVIFSFFFWSVMFQSILGLLLAIPLSAFCVVFWRALKGKIQGVV